MYDYILENGSIFDSSDRGLTEYKKLELKRY